MFWNNIISFIYWKNVYCNCKMTLIDVNKNLTEDAKIEETFDTFFSDIRE